MTAIFVFAILRFGFERDMNDVFVQEFVTNGFLDLFPVESFSYHHVGGHGVLRSGKRPYVHVVHVRNSGYREDRLFDVGNIHVGRHAVEIHADGLLEEIHDAPYHHYGDDDRNDRIDHRISGEVDYRPSDNDPERYERVPEKVEVCRFDVDVFLGSLHEKKSGCSVYDNPDRGDCHHGPADGFYGIREPVDRFDDEVGRRQDQKNAIHERGEHACPSVAIGEGFGASESGSPNGDSRYNKTQNVHRVVPGIRKEGEGMNAESEESLYRHEDGIDRDGAEERI